MEHHHRCLYCSADWFCHDDCVIAGPAVCESCLTRRRRTPGPDAMPRLIPMSNGRWPLDRLIEREAALVRERWRGFWLRRKRPIGEP